MISSAYAAVSSDITPHSIFASPSFWVAIAFVVFIAIFARPIWQFTIKSLDSKINEIEASIDEATNLRKEAQDLLASYKRKLADAEQEAKAIVNEARKEALKLKTQMSHDLEISLERREKLAIERITQAENDATIEVQTMTANIALTATQQLLIESLDDSKADTLINSSIQGLSEKLN
jgi:F-type H+-transporting ATPase subunit b